jgi:hypothetical protein
LEFYVCGVFLILLQFCVGSLLLLPFRFSVSTVCFSPDVAFADVVFAVVCLLQRVFSGVQGAGLCFRYLGFRSLVWKCLLACVFWCLYLVFLALYYLCVCIFLLVSLHYLKLCKLDYNLCRLQDKIVRSLLRFTTALYKIRIQLGNNKKNMYVCSHVWHHTYFLDLSLQC